jgi:hypothetical protein
LRIKSIIERLVVPGTKQEGINKKEEEKRAKYLMRCNQGGLEFKPFVLDSFERMRNCENDYLNYADGLNVSKAKYLKGKVSVGDCNEFEEFIFVEREREPRGTIKSID